MLADILDASLTNTTTRCHQTKSLIYAPAFGMARVTTDINTTASARISVHDFLRDLKVPSHQSYHPRSSHRAVTEVLKPLNPSTATPSGYNFDIRYSPESIPSEKTDVWQRTWERSLTPVSRDESAKVATPASSPFMTHPPKIIRTYAESKAKKDLKSSDGTSSSDSQLPWDQNSIIIEEQPATTEETQPGSDGFESVADDFPVPRQESTVSWVDPGQQPQNHVVKTPSNPWNEIIKSVRSTATMERKRKRRAPVNDLALVTELPAAPSIPEPPKARP